MLTTRTRAVTLLAATTAAVLLLAGLLSNVSTSVERPTTVPTIAEDSPAEIAAAGLRILGALVTTWIVPAIAGPVADIREHRVASTVRSTRVLELAPKTSPPERA